MELKIKIMDEGFEPTKTKMVCVSKYKYADVHLCFDIGGWNVEFADLSVNDGTYSDKESQFKALSELGHNIANAWNEKYNLIKPFLRPLSDMSEIEAIHIAKLALNIHADTDMTTISIIPYSDGEIKIKAHYYNTMLGCYDDDIVTIDDSFDISHNEHSLSVFNQPQIFQYLIQCQFDVFGWIKSGTALDKTKI